MMRNEDIFAAVRASLEGRTVKNALLIPPDFTRFHSNAGLIAGEYYRLLTERGAQHASRFAAIQTLVRDALERPLSETLGVPAPDIKLERLRLLCALFDHSRKLGDGEEEGR